MAHKAAPSGIWRDLASNISSGRVSEGHAGMAEQTTQEKPSLFQRGLSALSDVFSEIMPDMLAAGLLASISNILGGFPLVQTNETLYGINRLIGIS